MENSQTYQSVTGESTNALEAAQDALKKDVLDRLFALLFFKGEDQSQYRQLMPKYHQEYTTGTRDFYPKSLATMFNVMQSVPIKKRKPGPENVKTGEEKVSLETSFPRVGRKKEIQSTEDCLLFLW